MVYNTSSSVEAYELAQSGQAARYPPLEKIHSIVVENFPLLGKLTAFRFIEWVQKNPGGVIALPTGKTPEHFIKWVQRIRSHWDSREIQSLLEQYGLNASQKPDMASLSFVQIDEFYPMDSSRHNSFHHYVSEMYLRGFGLPTEKALLIDATALGLPPGIVMNDAFPSGYVDLTLRIRKITTELERLQKSVINRVDEFCTEYEEKIRAMGGIGFFLGGIGPDGHIAFNVRGSGFYSVTRLTGTNYETQAAAAGDLGGIEIARNHLVITIGLSTITHNPTCTAIIMASGDAKAGVVADAIQNERNPQYPASALQTLENARFYLTRGAAQGLTERKFIDFSQRTQYTPEENDEHIIALSLQVKKPLLELTRDDFLQDRFCSRLLQCSNEPHDRLATGTRERMIANIEKGLRHVSQTTFLHTEPHHDDIMLGYLAHLYHLVRDATNRHYFANLTSGFTAVTNRFVLTVLQTLRRYLNDRELLRKIAEGYFKPDSLAGRMADVYLYLDGIASANDEKVHRAEAYRLLRNLNEVYEIASIEQAESRVAWLNAYFEAQYPGAKDTPDVQKLKGTFREFEVELLWAYFGIEAVSIRPLRLGFYTGDIFTEEPEFNRDALPIFEYMREIQPDIVSVAFDPEGSGPDTHYKALQAVAGALKLYREEYPPAADVRVWGYRNVWYRFKPSEANVFVPVSLNSLSMLNTAFMNCFASQRAAEFPSYEHDGPFSELAQKIQVEQYEMLKVCLGDEFFLSNSHPRLRAARGFIFLKEMGLDEFFGKVRELKQRTEAK